LATGFINGSERDSIRQLADALRGSIGFWILPIGRMKMIAWTRLMMLIRISMLKILI